MATLLAGLVELDVATAEPGGGRHHGVVQLELELVGTAPWLVVVGDVRLVRLGGSAHVGRAQDLAAVRYEGGIEGVAGAPGPLDSQPAAMVDVHQVSPEAVLHTTRHRKIRLGIGVGWRDDPPAARDKVGWRRTAGRRL